MKGDYHPALRQAVKDLIDRRNWKKLQDEANHTEDDAQVGRMFKDFLRSL